eukprot:g20383.t3
MPSQKGFMKPQRSTSMGLAEGDKGSSGAPSSLDSPYSARLPTNPPEPAAASYGSKGKEMATPELIRPSPGNPSRQSQPQSAMFNLLATIVGGGVLSLPYAFRLTGVLTGIVLMALAAVAGDFSLYMLCSCARRTGQISYVEVAQAAFGKSGAFVTTSVLMIMTVFVMIAYMVLVRDIWTGIISSVVGRALDAEQSNQVLFVALAAVFPACLAKDLHALRHFCYIGFFSAMVLTAAIAYRSVEANNMNPAARLQLKLNADSWGDIFEAFPILCLSFLCHFNILSVHSQFVNPTRERLKGLLHGTMGLTAALYIVLALCGYLYAFEDTKDDILLNFDPSDRVMILGRVGMGLNMLVAITMLVLPCRDIFFTVMGSLSEKVAVRRGDAAAGRVRFAACFSHSVAWPEHLIATKIQLLQASRLPRPTISKSVCCGREGYLPVAETGDTPTTPGGSPVSKIGDCLMMARHVLTTVAIMGFSLYCALSVPGVGIVWSICGSSVGFMVCYTLPSLFYLKIRWHKSFNTRKAGALLVLVVSMFAIIICTKHAVLQALQ